MHPYEAELTHSESGRSGGTRATKLFLEAMRGAGLLDPEPAEQTHGVFVIQERQWRNRKSSSRDIRFAALGSRCLCALEAEYERDQARIEELYKAIHEGSRNG